MPTSILGSPQHYNAQNLLQVHSTEKRTVFSLMHLIIVNDQMYNIFYNVLSLYIFIFLILYLTSSALVGLLCTFHTEEFPVVLLHARDRYIKHSFYTVIVLPDEEVSGCHNITVNVI